jgi:RND family efflux transporter MFP subunit
MTLARDQAQPRPSSMKWVVGGLALLLLILAGAWAYSTTRPKADRVVRRDIVAAIPADGEVIAPPGERADVRSPYKATVDEIYTTVGENESRGDVIVKLSIPSADAIYQQARQNVKDAETTYANAKREYDAAVAAAQRQVDAARAAERAAVQPPPVATTPNGSAAVPPPAVPPPAVDPTAAAQTRAAAEQALQFAIAQRDAALAPQKQQLEAAREYFQQAQSGAKLAQVKTPISGTVLALNAKPGDVVGEDKTPVFTIVDLDALEIQPELNARQGGFVKAGMPVKLTVKEVPGEQFDGEVKSVTTQPAEGLKGARYVAIIAIENKGGKVKPGMKGTVAIEAGEVKDVLAVPNDAVKEDESGRPIVRVMRGGAWQPVPVEIGLTDGYYTEIKSGLQQGETVQVKKEIL